MTTDQSGVSDGLRPAAGSAAPDPSSPVVRSGSSRNPDGRRPGRLLGADALVVLTAALLALIAGFVVTQVATVTYEASAKVLLTPSASVDASADASSVSQAATLVSAQVPTWAALAQTPAVLDDAVATAGVDLASTQAVEAVDAAAQADTSIIEITATGSSAQDAAALASATASSLITQVEERTSVGGAALTTGSVVEQPALPTTPASPSLLLNLGVALAVGLAVGLGVVVARRALVARSRTA